VQILRDNLATITQFDSSDTESILVLT
jgi:hypothetical protein